MAKKIDLEALRGQIAELAIDKDLKHTLLEAINERAHYGLVWEESSEEAWDNMQDRLPVFVEDATKRLDAAPEGSPNHVLIEGDNLNALAALSYSHAGKIDVIYIDPPYNTGNKDFVYNDSFVDKEDGYRHSKWLSFMNRRLRIAKKLLSEKGVIFISIDDNEQAQLKMLCDELFGARNCLATVVQKSRDSISGDLLFSPNHNYLLVYAKKQELIFANKDNFRIPVEVNEKLFKNPDNDPRGPWKLNPVDGPGGARKGNPYYTFLGITGFYRYSEEMMQKYYEDGLIIKRKTSLGKKYFLSQAKAKKGVPPTTWWDDAGKTANGTKLLQQIVPETTFNNPKPIELIVRCLQLLEKDATILDFFAGSGTTLHATMQLNSEDGGHRKCILVTNNENNICENVTYERNKRVIQGYTTPKGEQVAGLANNNLRYYKTELVPREQNNKNRRALTAALVDLLCIKNDIYKEEETFGGERFKKSVLRYFKDEAGQMLVVLDERVVSTIVPMIARIATKENPLKVYVYGDGPYAYDDEFHEVMPVIELCAMPDAFLQAVNDILPEQKYSEAMIAEFNANQAIAEQDKEAVAEALSDNYDYVTNEEAEGEKEEQEEFKLTNEQ